MATAHQDETRTLTYAQAMIYVQVQLAGVPAGTECANAEVAGLLGLIGTNCCGGCVAPAHTHVADLHAHLHSPHHADPTLKPVRRVPLAGHDSSMHD